MDVRALAVFRVGLGIAMIVDSLQLVPWLYTLFGDDSIVPRWWAIGPHSSFTLLHAGGDTWFVTLFFALYYLTALAIIVGYRANLAMLLGCIMAASVQYGNTYIDSGASDLLKLYLLWGAFLPVGARWSLDAALRPTPPQSESNVFSISSAVLIFQIMALYMCGAAMKTGADWHDGSALEKVLRHAPTLTEPWTNSLLAYPGLLKFGTHAALALEYVAPVLFLLGGWPRAIGMLALIGLHVGIESMLAIGAFPTIAIAGLLVLIPAQVWNLRKRRFAEGATLFYDDASPYWGRVARLTRVFLCLDGLELRPAREDERAHTLQQQHASWVLQLPGGPLLTGGDALIELMTRSPLRVLGRLLGLRPLRALVNWAFALSGRHPQTADLLIPSYRARRWRPRYVSELIVLVLAAGSLGSAVLNAAGLKQYVPSYVSPLGLSQSWGMFAPVVIRDVGWAVAEARTQSGRVIDPNQYLLHGRTEVSYERPAALNGFIGSERWRKYWESAGYDVNLAQFFTGYLCHYWNTRHSSDTIVEIKLTFLEFKSGAGPMPRLLYTGACPQYNF
ncbi:hypothetical protein HNR42_003538 [Deinobacterium chartae]|uniref:HTTM-like domain-containing protein n=1 Tax=Deinobacterium chartae TaxID=521158 RepID=A0A841I431_9DEIO|nr:HTTM domain-containing protein [Deinobacterium chartae]MBB6100073.1 hypothetical protein [Deinobacterium chartae]